MISITKAIVPFVLIICILTLLPGTYFSYSYSFSQSYKSVISYLGDISARIVDPVNKVLDFFGLLLNAPIDVSAYKRDYSDSNYFISDDPVVLSYYDASTTAVQVKFDSEHFSGYIDSNSILQYQWLWDMRYNGDCYFFFDDRGNYTCHYRYDKPSNSYVFERLDYFTQSYYNSSLSLVKIIMTPIVGSSRNPLSYNGDLSVISITNGFNFIRGKF